MPAISYRVTLTPKAFWRWPTYTTCRAPDDCVKIYAMKFGSTTEQIPIETVSLRVLHRFDLWG